MTAVIYKFDPTIAPCPWASWIPRRSALAVAAIAILIVALGLIGAMVDGHLAARGASEAERLRAHIAELEATKAELESTSRNLARAGSGRRRGEPTPSRDFLPR